MGSRTSAIQPLPRPAMRAPLRGRPLLLVRLVWVVLVCLTLGLVVIGIITTFESHWRARGNVVADLKWNDQEEAVLWPWPGYAAAEAGIAQGDVLLAIDDVPVPPGMPLASALDLLSGPVGSQVTLTIRTSDDARRQVTLTRTEYPWRGEEAKFGLPPRFGDIYFPAFEVVLILSFLTTGMLVVSRRSDDWLLLYFSLTLILVGPNFSYVYDLLWQAHPEWGWLLDFLKVLALSCILPGFFLLPNGRFVPRWTAVLTAGWISWNLGQYFFPDAAISLSGWVGWRRAVLYLCLYTTGIYAQVYRYRYVSSPIERQQTKWVMFGLTIAILGFFSWAIMSDAIPALREGPGEARFIFWLIGRPIYVLTLMLVPLTIAIAVLRYRLWDIDLVIRRTLVYSTLSATLATVYFSGVVLLQAISRAVVGQNSNFAIAASTLVIAVLFQPLRRRIQSAIDQQFYRRRYDLAQTLADFGTQLRQETDLEQVSTRLVRAVRETTQPAYVSLWLRPPEARPVGHEGEPGGA